MENFPILYSFRRCPYAMRARMAVSISGQTCRLREVVFRNKPPEMIAASPKATVPILVLPDGRILEESLEIMDWALGLHDPETWRPADHAVLNEMEQLIARFDDRFKFHLDRYKYATRYDGADPHEHRAAAIEILQELEERLQDQSYLFGETRCYADIALAPFIRQFANTDIKWFEAQPLPALQDWLNKFLTSDLFTGVMAKYPAWQSGAEEPLFPS